MKPWISVIVPVYNVEKYIDRCVKSLLGQKFKNLEIILVDDGSVDSSGAKCDDYAVKHNEIIKVVHKKNGGLASARNEGMKYADGEYIAFVDSDDWMEEETYDILYKRVKNSNPDIITYGYRKIKDNKIISEGRAKFEEGFYSRNEIQNLILPDSIAEEKAFNQINLPVQLSACMCIYKSSFLKKNKIYFESERIVLNEDWLFNICCLCRADSFQVIHEKLYNYDTRDTSLSMSFKNDSYERKCNLYKRYKEELELTGNLNDITTYRLKNFWLESIYCCYIIELCAPAINKSRIAKMFSDNEFRQELRNLNLQNSTLKGILFKYVVKFKFYLVVKLMYVVKKKGMRIK